MQKNDDLNWYVFYTRPRFEKKIQKRLNSLDFDTCLPMYESIRQWKDRKKKVDMLYFPNYIFVKCVDHDIWDVLSTNGVVGFVKKEGKPATLSDNEANAIVRLEKGNNLVADSSEFKVKQSVIVNSGPMKDLVGEIIDIKNQFKLGVQIKAINKYLVFEISPAQIDPVYDESLLNVSV